MVKPGKDGLRRTRAEQRAADRRCQLDGALGGKGSSAPERLTNWLLHLLGKTRILFLCNRAAVLPVKTEEKKDFPKILEKPCIWRAFVL